MSRGRRRDTVLVRVILLAFAGFLLVPLLSAADLVRVTLSLVFGAVTFGGPVLLGWRAVGRASRRHRAQLWWASAAVSSFAAGQLCLFLVGAGVAATLFSVLATLCFLGFYPCLLAAFVIGR